MPAPMSRPIRVCHVITHLAAGGAQLNTLHTVSHLDPARYEVSLITGVRGELVPFLDDLGGVTVIREPALVREVRPHLDYRACRSIARHLRRLRPDIVHSHTPKAGILGRWAARSVGVPVRVHTHHGFGFHDDQSWIAYNLFLGSERLARRVTTHAIVVSEENRTRAIRLGVVDRDACTLIRSGVALEPYHEMWEAALHAPDRRREMRGRAKRGFDVAPDVGVVTMVAGLRPVKAPVDVVRLGARLREIPGRSLELWLVGDGELRRDVEAGARELGLKERAGAGDGRHARGVGLRLWGHRNDVPRFLEATDLLLLTSRWEGMPRVFPEAMAAGLPIVANAVGGCGDAVTDGENGFLVERDDLDTMARRVARLIDDPDEADRFGARSAGRFAEFDIDEMMRRQDTLYQELVREYIRNDRDALGARTANARPGAPCRR